MADGPGLDVLARFDDFSKGHYGDNALVGNGWYGGYNFHHLPNGGVKIRNATTAMSNTGMANADVTIAPVSGGVFAATGTATWYVPISGAAPTSLTALAASAIANDHDWCFYATSTTQGALFTLFGDKTYKVNASSVTGLTGSPGGSFVAQLGDRIYVASISGNLNRIRYSDAANENSWTSSNLIDIGISGNEVIVLMKRQRNSLVIATTSGSYTSWYRLSGTPGVDLRVDPITPRGPSLIAGAGDQVNPHLVEGYGSRVWFTPSALDGNYGWIGWIDADTPIVSNKIRPVNPSHPAQGTVAAAYGVAANPSYPLVLMLAASFGVSTVNQRALLYLDGAWAQMTFPITKGLQGAHWDLVSTGQHFVISQAGSSGGGVKPIFFSWALDNTIDNAPSITDSDSTIVTGELHTPIVIDPGHDNIQVQAVQVDYRHYSSSTAMTCQVETHGITDAGGTVLAPQTSSTSAFTVSGAPLTTGQRGRKTFYVGDALPGMCAQVKLTSCVSVAVERIVVLGRRYPPGV